MKKYTITNRRNQAVKLKVGGGFVDLAAGAEVVRWLSEEQAALAAGAAKIEVAEVEEPKPDEEFVDRRAEELGRSIGKTLPTKPAQKIKAARTDEE